MDESMDPYLIAFNTAELPPVCGTRAAQEIRLRAVLDVVRRMERDLWLKSGEPIAWLASVEDGVATKRPLYLGPPPQATFVFPGDPAHFYVANWDAKRGCYVGIDPPMSSHKLEHSDAR